MNMVMDNDMNMGMEIVSDMDMVKDMVAEMARDKKRTPGTEF
jgi:hypothetical protein